MADQQWHGGQPQYQQTFQPYALNRTWPTGARIGAWFIDFGIYLVLSLVLRVIFGTPASTPSSFCTETERAAGTCTNTGIHYVTGPIPTLIGLLWFVAIFGVLQGLTGGSLGKLAVGLRVVGADGQLAGIPRCLLRSVLWIVDGFPYCIPLVGIVTFLASDDKRRVGDRVAGTWVVRKEEVGRSVHGGPVAPASYGAYPQGYGFVRPPAPPAYPPAPPDAPSWGTPPPPPPEWPPQR